MTSLQLAIFAGMIIMMGPVLILLRYSPKHPALGPYLESVNNTRTGTPVLGRDTTDSAEDRIGLWLQRHVGSWLNIPREELEILQTPVHKHLVQRALFALVGLCFPALLSLLLWAIGITVPIGIPIVGSLAIAIGLSFIPDLNARTNAAEAREEFRYVLGSYMDLVALERRAAAAPSPRQAMAQAATVGDSWVFKRLSEELAHSRLSGIPPWDRLKELGQVYRINELVELGNIMRIAGDESASVYETLSQRSKAMRKAHLAKELTAANEVSTKRSAPVALLGVVFMVLLIVPGLLGVLEM